MVLSQAQSGLSAVWRLCPPQLSVVHTSTAYIPLVRALPHCRLPHSRASLRHGLHTSSVVARCMSASADTAELIEQKNSENPVVIYSKSYCPFSGEVKALFKKLEVEYKAFELDEIVEGEDVLDALMDKTSSRTVPQVFVNGQYIGGCAETKSSFKSGKLKEIFEAAGVAAKF